MSRRIGLYGGMFDPIHVGHIGLAIALMEAASLDEVWVCPAACSPHKTASPATPAYHRMRMVELAVEPIPGIKAVDDELLREPPSYTIETVRALRALHPSVDFRLLLGSDSLARLGEWRDIEELIRLAPPLIGRRSIEFSLPKEGSELVQKACLEGWIETPLFEVSSSDLRSRLRLGRYCGHLIPEPSYQYLIQEKLYLA